MSTEPKTKPVQRVKLSIKDVVIAVLLIALLAVFVLNREKGSKTGTPHLGRVEDFTLWDQNGVSHNLYYYSDAKAIVLISFGLECPIARLSINLLTELQEQYEEKGIVFLLLDPNPGDKRKELMQEAEAFNIKAPILMDSSQYVSRGLKIQRTAEAIVVRPKDRAIVYRGAISDQLNYETQKEKATKHYLKWAIEAVLKEKSIAIDQTEVKGCLFHYEPAKEDLSYVNDVAPILEQHCLKCHYADGVAPWAMSGYENITNWGPMIREVIRTRRMPPRSLDMTYLPMRGASWLTPEEAKVLVDWVEQGMPRGEGEDPIPGKEARTSNTKWPWGEPDLIISTEEPVHVHPTEWMDWEIEHALDAFPEDVWIKAVYVNPENEPVVHHSSVFVSVPETNADMRRVSMTFMQPDSYNIKTGKKQPNPFSDSSELYLPFRKKPKALFNQLKSLIKAVVSGPRFKQSGGEDREPEETELKKEEMDYWPAIKSYWEIIGMYNPGYHPPPYPKGTGKFIPKGASIRFTTHYKPIGKPETNRVHVGLYFHKKEDYKNLKTLYHNVFHGNDFVVPSGEKNYSYAAGYRLKEGIRLYGAGPHVHYGTTSVKMLARLPDKETPLVLFSDPDFNYDFNYMEYRFEKPLELPAGTELIFEGIFDNSSQNLKNVNPEQDAVYGFQRQDEMFWGGVLYSLLDED